MSAYVETLCDHCGIVRVGASAPFPARYKFSVAYVTWGDHVEPVGFDHKKISPTDFRDGIKALNAKTGKIVAYRRAGSPPYRVIQTDPALTKGRIVMTVDRSHLSKTHIPSPARAQHRDGSIDETVLETDAAKAFTLFKDKQETMLNVERVVLADGSVIDMFHHIATNAIKT